MKCFWELAKRSYIEFADRLGKEERVVVVINEWGQIGLDGIIIASQHPTLAVREITGGCVCCRAGATLHHKMQPILSDLIPGRIMLLNPTGWPSPEKSWIAWPPQLAARLDVRPLIGLVDPDDLSSGSQSRFRPVIVF